MRTSSGVKVSFCISIIAAAAETKGAAAEVPEKSEVYSIPKVVYTFIPGAAISTVEP